MPKQPPDEAFFRKPPRQARSRELVARLLGAARTLLEREGLQRLTTNHIAREAGVDVASLYQYFGSKEAVLYTLAEQWVEQVQAVYARQLAALGEGPTLVASLRTRGIRCGDIHKESWGLRTSIPLPSGAQLGLYQPTHPTALGL